MSEVAIAQNFDIQTSINSALEKLDLTKILKNKLVAIKPNETWASLSDLTPVTQADSLDAVISYVKKFSPKHIVVTGGAGAGETADIFEISGMMEVVGKHDVEFFDHNKPPFKTVKLKRGSTREIVINPRVLEYETLISLANLKVHDTAIVTLTMKNIAMSYPAADYYGHPRWHRLKPHRFFDNMQEHILAMSEKFRPDLGIITGHPAMTEQGPIGGKTFETGLTIASRDFVTADAVGAKILGFEPAEIDHIWGAKKLGLGEADLSQIEILGLSLEETLSKFQELARD